MAAGGSTETPLIVEPTASPKASSLTSLPTVSPDPSYSSNFFNSSRPQSSCSNTSQSDVSQSPSENPDHDPLQDPIDLPSSTALEIDQLLPPSNLSPITQPSSANIPPRSVPSNWSTNTNAPSMTTTSSQNSWFRSLRTRLHERRWLENTTGALGLATALWLGVRGYKMAVWQYIDLRQLHFNYQ